MTTVNKTSTVACALVLFGDDKGFKINIKVTIRTLKHQKITVNKMQH